MRRVALILGVLAVAVAAIIATGVYRPSDDDAAAPASEPVAAAPAPAGSLALGAQAGELAVGLDAQRTDGGLALTATVLGQEGLPVDGLDVSFVPKGEVPVAAAPCGTGCYRAELPADGAARVAVRLTGDGPAATATFEIPAGWKPADDVVRRLTDAYRELRSVAYDEHLASAPGNAIQTRWELEAPDRLSYRIAGGNDGIVIGDRRWDRSPGAGWVESPAEPVDVPEPPWQDRFRGAALLGSAEVDGRPAWVVSFVSALGLPTWFTVWVEKTTYRPLELRMTTAAHFMRQRYRSFDQPLSIVAPR